MKVHKIKFKIVSHHHPIVQNSHRNHWKSLPQRRYGWYHLGREVSYLRLYFHHYITQRRAAASTVGDRLREDRRCFGFHHHGWSTTLDLPTTGPAVTRSIPFSQAFYIFSELFPFFLLLSDFLDWQPWILTTDTHQHISIFLVSGFGFFFISIS